MVFRHLCMAVLIAFIFGFNASIVKLGVKSMNPLLYTAWRYILIWPLLFFIPRPKTSWKNIVFVSVTTGGTTTLAAVILCLGVGAGLSSVVLQTQVFFTVLLAILVWREWPACNNWIGMIVAFVGVACIALRIGDDVSYLGIFLTLCGALCWASGNIVLRELRSINIVHLLVWGSLVLPIPLMILSCIFYGASSVVQNPLNYSGMTLASIVYSGFISGLGGNILLGILLRHYPATVVAPFMLLVPVSGLMFAYFILGETLTLLSGVGCFLVFAGLSINQWRKEKAEDISSRDTLKSASLSKE